MTKDDILLEIDKFIVQSQVRPDDILTSDIANRYHVSFTTAIKIMHKIAAVDPTFEVLRVDDGSGRRPWVLRKKTPGA